MYVKYLQITEQITLSKWFLDFDASGTRKLSSRFSKHKHSQTCVHRSPFGPKNMGLCLQVVVVQRSSNAIRVQNGTLK